MWHFISSHRRIKLWIFRIHKWQPQGYNWICSLVKTCQPIPQLRFPSFAHISCSFSFYFVRCCCFSSFCNSCNMWYQFSEAFSYKFHNDILFQTHICTPKHLSKLKCKAVEAESENKNKRNKKKKILHCL